MNTISLVLAGAVVIAMLGGALLMTSGDYGVAGALFLSASVMIYLRERWI